MNRKLVVVWVAPTTITPFPSLRWWTARRGYVVIPCKPGASAEIRAGLGVLWSGFFDTHEAFVDEYERDKRPTLVIVTSDSDEIAAERSLRPADKVCKVDASRLLFSERLRRLAELSNDIDHLKGIALRDALSDLPNRQAFENAIHERSSDGAAVRAVLLLDINDFKWINDVYGHAAGDHVIATIANRLRAASRSDDFIARIGGEEFAVVMRRTDPTLLVRDAEALRQTAGRELVPLTAADSHQASVTLSGGLFLCLESAAFGEEGLKKADAALYAAKAAGRNCLVTYDTLANDAAASGQDIKTRTFQNVTKVVTQRVTNLITLFGVGLVEEASAKHAPIRSPSCTTCATSMSRSRASSN